MDLSKAFDCVDHEILLDKIHLAGIRGNLWDLIKTYLSKREQYVEIDNKKGDTKPTSFSVPQGCISSPTFYSIYTKDLDKSMNTIDTCKP